MIKHDIHNNKKNKQKSYLRHLSNMRFSINYVAIIACKHELWQARESLLNWSSEWAVSQQWGIVKSCSLRHSIHRGLNNVECGWSSAGVSWTNCVLFKENIFTLLWAYWQPRTGSGDVIQISDGAYWRLNFSGQESHRVEKVHFRWGEPQAVYFSDVILKLFRRTDPKSL